MKHRFLNNKINKFIFFSTILLSLFVLYIIFEQLNTDIDKVLQWPILYYHLPLAINTFFAYSIVTIFSIIYIRTNNEIWDTRAYCIAEVGTLYCFLVLVTGSIWAKLNWGVYWSWEPRLVSTFLLFILYLIYFMIRKFGGHYEKSSKLAAVVSILAFIDIPIIYFAVDMWSPEVQLHPQRDIKASDPMITAVLPVAILSFTSLLLLLSLYRLHLEKECE